MGALVTARAKLALLCARLYDSRTPDRVRRRLSFEVSVLRSALAGGDPLDMMQRASVGEEECDG